MMILLVLIQKGRGGGLSSAFGGSGGNTAFGAKTGDVLTWATSIVFALFVALAVILNLVCDRIGGSPQPTQQTQQAPASPSSPTPGQ
jgi:preprotein translocase subunit SecG